MSTLDTVLLVALVLGLVRGLWTGALRQVASLAGLVLAFLVAVPLMRPAGELVGAVLGASERVAPIIGFVIVFGLIQLLLFVALRFLEKIVGMLRLGVLNRLAGGALGALKVALLFSALFLVLGAVGLPGRGAREASVLYGPVAASLPATWRVVAGPFGEARELSERFGQYVELPRGAGAPEE